MKTLVMGMCVASLMMLPVVSGNAMELGHNDMCNISLNYDVAVSPKQMVVSNQGKEHYRIEGEHLYVDGKEVALNASQKKLLLEYRDGMAKQMPEVIAVVADALDIAGEAVNSALTPLLGAESNAKLADMMTTLRNHIDKIFHQQGDSYYIAATDESLDKAFEDEFSAQVEQLVTQSMGAIMMNIGKSMMEGDGDISEKMDAFGQRMDKLGDEIEAKVDDRSKSLDKRADKLCSNFEQLIKVENELREKVPELAAYPLVSGRP